MAAGLRSRSSSARGKWSRLPPRFKLAEQIDTEVSGEPAALGVIVGTGYGHRREDGIVVIPLGALRP
jgi:hypothetical protein